MALPILSVDGDAEMLIENPSILKISLKFYNIQYTRDENDATKMKSIE